MAAPVPSQEEFHDYDVERLNRIVNALRSIVRNLVNDLEEAKTEVLKLRAEKYPQEDDGEI